MQKQSSRRCLAVIAGLVLAGAALLSPLPVSAHHGWGGYLDKEFEISGTAETPVSLAGPHATMKLRDAEGHVWDVVLAPGVRTEQAGLKDGMIPVGAKIMAHGHRHSDPKRYEIKTERLTWNNKVYNVYPDRE
jgi:hypothetical protein